jgi:hypothetical protein
MNKSDLRLELERWGNFQSLRFKREQRSEDAPGSHPLSRAREFAPMTRAVAAKLLAGRDGRSRRALQASTAGSSLPSGIAPHWSTDPIVCKETRTPGPPIAQFDRGMPQEYRWVEHGLINLGRTSPVQAAAVRIEFTVAASQGVKARMVSEETGVGVSKWQYRRVLELGLSYLAGQRG